MIEGLSGDGTRKLNGFPVLRMIVHSRVIATS